MTSNVWQSLHLGNSERERLTRGLRIFLAEKHWEGCGGLSLTDEVRVTISAYAALMALGWDDFHFEEVRSILVYPSLFISKRIIGPLRYEDVEDARAGEAHYLGTIIVAWDEVLASGRRKVWGNVVLHELAHHLDMLSGGDVDGTPPLPSKDWDRWRELLAIEHQRLVKRIAAGAPTFLDPYAAEDPGEFFAVATEAFFEHPRGFRGTHPELYEAFRRFYRRDPAIWELSDRAN